MVADMGPVVAGAHQRPVDAGRAHLEMIFAIDRILDVEHGREVFAEPLAIGDGEAAVLVLGHDLQRAAIVLRDLHADQRVAEVVGDGLDNARNPRFEPSLPDVSFLVQVERHGVRRWSWKTKRAGAGQGTHSRMRAMM
jgi:hypothetical protein